MTGSSFSRHQVPFNGAGVKKRGRGGLELLFLLVCYDCVLLQTPLESLGIMLATFFKVKGLNHFKDHFSPSN